MALLLKTFKDRKMEGRKMFTARLLLHDEHCFNHTKLYFSVFVFVQANLTLSSDF